MSNAGWVGVDLDGVLAIWDERIFPDIGPPIQRMIDRVRGWIEEGTDVRIFTARIQANPDEPDWCASAAELLHLDTSWVRTPSALAERWVAGQRGRIENFCIAHFGVPLPITASKDWKLIEIWDDRCVQMELNTGWPILEQLQIAMVRELKKR